MNLLCVVVTHNRLEYTQRCIDAYLDTCGEPLIVVDNASTDGTEQLATIRLRRNLFPGAATNIGWHHGLKEHPDTQLLMRLDNDIELLPGWREEVENVFEKIPRVGMLGILNLHEDFPDGARVDPFEENGHSINTYCPRGVGGNAVIRRELWDKGLRWTPGAWSPGGNDEDSRFAADVEAAGPGVARVIPTIANNMSFHRYTDYPEYYQRTAAIRGLVPELSV